MNEHFNPDREGHDNEADEADPGAQLGFRHPIDMNDEEWRDEQYGRVGDARRLAAEGGLRVNLDDDLAALEALMAKSLSLANAQFDFVTDLGNPELGEKQIRGAIALTGCFKGLLKTRYELLDSIGKRR